jgi:sec-independent protein translocase protein TatB
MLSLSPAKLLVILVIALIVLGPEKLPQVARQIGALWHDLREWRSRVESEVRGTFPNLPPTHEVAQAVRSPLAFLDRLADEHERGLDEQADETTADPVGPAATDAMGPAPPADGVGAVGVGNGTVPGGNGAGPGHGSVLAHGTGADNGAAGHNGSGAAATGPADTVVPDIFPAVPDDPSMN